MIFQESETVELKEIMIDSINKEIIAFANCDGGTIYVGVSDNGIVVGVDNPDSVSLQISNIVRDTIKPDITMFLHYETMVVNEKKVVVVKIQRDTNRPYYLAKKGMRSEGVYVRQGYSAVPATDAAIRHMIKETDGNRFELRRSLEQRLTFEETRKEFEFRNVDFGNQQMRTLKMIDNDEMYSNLAMLLSDQCTHTIKVAIFQGTDQTVFKDRREFTGSLMKQMKETYDYIDFHNQTHATIEKLYRIDTRDYPEIAVRESLLNIIVHRDYSFSASALISMYEDRIEFVSIGGLVPGIEIEDIMMGISVCRNQELANVFYRLHLIEAYGTGMSKIMNAYACSEQKPIIEATKNAFKIILPNINAKHDKKSKILEGMDAKQDATSKDELGEEERIILEYIKAHGSIKTQNVADLLEVSTSTAVRVIRYMVSCNLLIPKGKARNTHYIIAE